MLEEFFTHTHWFGFLGWALALWIRHIQGLEVGSDIFFACCFSNMGSHDALFGFFLFFSFFSRLRTAHDILMILLFFRRFISTKYVQYIHA